MLFGDGGGDGGIIKTCVGTFGFVVGDDVFEYAFDTRDRNGKTDALSIGRNGCIDADDFPGGIYEGATRVAWIDGGVGLDHVG